MQIQAQTISKYRDGSQDGDDALIAIPNLLYGVFDGVTDVSGQRFAGKTTGEWAAISAAQAAAQVALSIQAGQIAAGTVAIPTTVWTDAINTRIDLCKQQLGIAPHVRLCSTAALACLQGDTWHFFICGDSAIRINAGDTNQEWIHPTKLVDTVFTHLRMACFEAYRAMGQSVAESELNSRQCAFLGMRIHGGDAAAHISPNPATPSLPIPTNFVPLPPATCASILQKVATQCADLLAPDAQAALPDLLQSGIMLRQFDYANHPSHSLGFAALVGHQGLAHFGKAATVGADCYTFSRPASLIHTLEFCTDGYALPGQEAIVSSWEAQFDDIEDDDYYKVGRYAAIKGSTDTQFSDDRSVLVVKIHSK